jgi:hypothetical protein
MAAINDKVISEYSKVYTKFKLFDQASQEAKSLKERHDDLRREHSASVLELRDLIIS